MNHETIPDLDDINAVKNIDKSNMLTILEHLPDHIKDAAQIPPVELDSFEPKLIAVLGMGGSAICGDIIEAWLHKVLKIPLIVVRGYDLPKVIDSDSLVFAVSFSGNTEETLHAFEEAVSRKAKVVTISTGGTLAERANHHNVPHIKLEPRETLVPRAAIAYLLFPVISNLSAIGLIPSGELKKELEDAIVTLTELKSRLSAQSSTTDNQAKQIAKKLKNNIPIIYSYRPFTCISYRWRTQLNENSKIHSANFELPEMDHNDIVGWMGDDHANKYCVIILRDPALESERMAKRIQLTSDLAFSRAHEIIEIFAEGKSTLSKMLSLMYIGDFTSVYLAILRGIDPTPVDIIENLKKIMSD